MDSRYCLLNINSHCANLFLKYCPAGHPQLYVPPSHEPTLIFENVPEVSDMRILELEIDVGASQVFFSLLMLRGFFEF
jgi:hypothetical protein